MQYNNIQEEEIKNKLAVDFFGKFDCKKILGKIDFAVRLKRPAKAIYFNNEYLLWAEAKQKTADIIAMLAQLVLTIGKARTFNELLPPKFLGCFDNEKIAFIPYHDVQDIFYQNDFNWNVAPSNHETREFKQIYEKIKSIIENDIPFETYLFNFEKEGKELKRFIRKNFIGDKSETTKIRIDKNNFINIYNKWRETVQPTIAVNWEIAKKSGIIDGDFYLADLISENNKSIKDNLFILLKSKYYEADGHLNTAGLFTSSRLEFSDNQKAYAHFWAKYARPPIEDYWDYIINHRHLLVPQDIRERKGSFYTPRIWVEKSQEYLAKVLGKDWQDEYYVWDCAAGTGNLLVGLTNKYNIWASTLDKADVDVMKDRIANGANLLHAHVFQFDFLNDDFTKLPDGLQTIINDPKLRQKLIIYINPPYAETNAKKGTKKGFYIGKSGINLTKQREKYNDFLGMGKRELFAQFMSRIYNEITGCKIGMFSTLKALNSPFFSNFRNKFLAKLETCFIMPANDFDNVNGHFPIGFQIWDTNKKERFKKISSDVFDKKGAFLTQKNLYSYENIKYINDWILQFRHKINKRYIIGRIFCVGSDFQHQSYCRLNSQNIKTQAGFTIIDISIQNLIECCVFFAVRHCIPATWLNDRDQFFYPNDGWKTDLEFQNDCLAYTLFSGQNRISAKHGINHWIPFTETEVDAKEKYENHFMIDYLSMLLSEPRLLQNFQNTQDLFLYENINQNNHKNQTKIKVQTEEQPKREFSAEAQAVFDAGRELWKYYHAQKDINVNASLYDIREYFQGRNDKGKMKHKSDDEKYNELIGSLRESLYILAKKIEPKVYEYEFLMR